MSLDFNQQPLVVIWEVTQACDLACLHCRASAQPQRHPGELSTEEAHRLMDEIKELGAPIFVLTGGDPLKRPDIFDLVEYGAQRGLRPSLTPSATPLLTREAIFELKKRGLVRLAVSLDGPTAAVHDSIRGVSGSYQKTLDAVEWAGECHLPVQINTTISRHNYAHVEEIERLLTRLKIVLWSVFFLVPTGRGQLDDLISAEECEQVFEKLHRASQRVKFHIKTTEAQHYRRFLLGKRIAERWQQGMKPETVQDILAEELGRARQGVNDAKGFVFVSHKGEVFPSGFLPETAGNVRQQSLTEIYRNSPLFVALRDTSKLKGKCGVCEFHELCGGSRARAFAVTGDAFAEEPCCIYHPQAWPAMEGAAVS